MIFKFYKLILHYAGVYYDRKFMCIPVGTFRHREVYGQTLLSLDSYAFHHLYPCALPL